MSNSFVTPWTVAHQAPLSMVFPRKEYWCGLPFPPRGVLPDVGIKPTSPALAARFFTTSTTWEALLLLGHTSSSLKGSFLSSHYLSIFCPQTLPSHYLFLKSQLKYFVFNCVSPKSFKHVNCISYYTLHTVHGVLKADAEVVWHSLLQWTMFCQNSPP